MRAKKLRREIRYLVRLIEDNGIGAAEQITKAVLLQSQVREQQVMIDDDDVRLECLPPRERHMTARDLRTTHSETALARGGHLRPHRVRVRQAAHLGEVAVLRGAGPA